MSLGPGTSALTPTLVDPPRLPARAATVRRQFARRAATIAAHDVLLREVARRMDERLDLIRLAPRLIADVGCGTGADRGLLGRRFPAGRWLGFDACLPMLLAGGVATGGIVARLAAPLVDRLRARPAGAGAGARCAADAGALPLRDRSVDLLWSNLVLHWHPEPHRLFPEWNRVLAPGGLLMFSAFGPDTLKELRAACAEAMPEARPLPFVDMHDFGDMMVAAGFVTPVMDVETLRLTYPSPAALLAEVRALGGNPRDDRPAALPSGRRARALHAALAARADAQGRIALTFEVAYGHAWRGATERSGDATVTRIDAGHLRAQLQRRR